MRILPPTTVGPDGRGKLLDGPLTLTCVSAAIRRPWPRPYLGGMAHTNQEQPGRRLSTGASVCDPLRVAREHDRPGIAEGMNSQLAARREQVRRAP